MRREGDRCTESRGRRLRASCELAPPALSAVTLRATCMRRLWEIAGDSVRSHLEGDLYAEPAARVDRALAAPAEDAVDDDVVC